VDLTHAPDLHLHAASMPAASVVFSARHKIKHSFIGLNLEEYAQY
jgi:hypothetical protein